MKKRIFAAVFGCALAVLIAGALLISAVLYNYYEARYVEKLKTFAKTVQSAAEYDERSLSALDFGDMRVTLVALDGSVLFDSATDPVQLGNHADREEIKQAIENGEGTVTRFSNTLMQKTTYYAVKTDMGVLRVAATDYTFGTMIAGALQPLAIVIIAAILAAAALSSAVTRGIMRPINAVDLDDAENAVTYSELSPFLKKIAQQRDSIRASADELKEKHEQFLTVAENMSEGLLLIDGGSHIVYVNGSARRMFGENPAPGDSVYSLCRSEPFREAVAAASEGRHGDRLAEQGGRIFRMMSSPISGGSAGAVIVVMDVTESEQRERLRREFAANVSHELKTPLTSISGYAEIIGNGIAKKEDITHFAEKIHSETARLIELVGDIIKLSQLDGAACDMPSETIALEKEAAAAAQSLAEPALKRGITISVEGSARPITAPRQLIHDILFNLADNAVKFNRDGGSVIISVFEAEGRPCVSVADTGMGIAAGEQERVFERFYRVEKSRSRAVGGTGLGLSIVKHAAAYLGAELKLESELSKGTKITVKFKKM